MRGEEGGCCGKIYSYGSRPGGGVITGVSGAGEECESGGGPPGVIRGARTDAEEIEGGGAVRSSSPSGLGEERGGA